MRFLLKGFIIVFLLSGCAAAVLMGTGVAGGYAIGRDYVQGEAEHKYERVYNSALSVVGSMGIIDSQFSNPSMAKIKARVENSSLEVNINRITRSSLRLRVKSRKNLMPNIELAQNVYNRILQQSK